MRTIRLFAFAVLAVLLSATSRRAQAQIIPNGYMNIDWQVNVPLSTSFAGDASGWGMNFEGGCYLTPRLSAGAFVGFHTNFEPVPRQTFSLDGGGVLTTAQEHAAFQLPFGLSGRYTWCRKSVFQPYVGVKMGAEYAQISSYYSVIKQYDSSWGFFVSPELGCTVFPCPETRIGLHVALYYSHATNTGRVLVYRVDGFDNFGLRIGLSF